MNQDQHYIPKTYLKRFVNTNKKIFTLCNEIINLPTRIKEFSPKGTGYKQNFYTIKDEGQLLRFGLRNPNFIEEHFSKYQEKNCNVLIDQLISSLGLMPKSEAVELTLLLLSFKQRNPALRKGFENKQNIETVAKRRWQEAIDQRSTIEPLLRKHDNKSFEEFLEYGNQWMEKFINNPDTPINTHTEGILKFLTGQSDLINKVAAGLLNSEWLLYKTIPEYPFITSDNPGFCIDAQGQIHTLNFSDTIAFCFPLSPLYCLIMKGIASDYNKTYFYKPVKQMDVNKEIVRVTNKATFITSYKYVYSNNENTLQLAWQDVHKQ